MTRRAISVALARRRAEAEPFPCTAERSLLVRSRMRSRPIALIHDPVPRAAMPPPRVSVVVPTYNEAKNLPHVFALLPDDLHEVIVVDGGSHDGTVDVAQSLRPDVRIVAQNRRGKGNALACGF